MKHLKKVSHKIDKNIIHLLLINLQMKKEI
jgi:hypothetical protein